MTEPIDEKTRSRIRSTGMALVAAGALNAAFVLANLALFIVGLGSEEKDESIVLLLAVFGISFVGLALQSGLSIAAGRGLLRLRGHRLAFIASIVGFFPLGCLVPLSCGALPNIIAGIYALVMLGQDDVKVALGVEVQAVRESAGDWSSDAGSEREPPAEKEAGSEEENRE